MPIMHLFRQLFTARCRRSCFKFRTLQYAHDALRYAHVDNFAEGVVIRPLRSVQFRNARGKLVRPLLKRKMAAFVEQSEVYDGAEKWSERLVPVALVQSSILSNFRKFVTLNRVHAAESKVGRCSAAAPPQQQALFVREIVDDILDAIGERIGATNVDRLPAPQLHEIKSEMALEVRRFLQANNIFC